VPGVLKEGGVITKWGFTVPGGLIDRLMKEYALHEATANYTLNPGIKERLTAKNVEIAVRLAALGVNR
jgi:hypothetical protein